VTIALDDVEPDPVLDADAHQYCGASLVVDEAQVDWLPEDEDEAYGPINFTHRFTAWDGQLASGEDARESEYEYDEEADENQEEEENQDTDNPSAVKEGSPVPEQQDAGEPVSPGVRAVSPSVSVSVDGSSFEVDSDVDDGITTSPRAHTRASIVDRLPVAATATTPPLPASPHYKQKRTDGEEAPGNAVAVADEQNHVNASSNVDHDQELELSFSFSE